jgi:ribosomal protein L17
MMNRLQMVSNTHCSIVNEMSIDVFFNETIKTTNKQAMLINVMKTRNI